MKKIWSFFSSIKTAITLFFLIALTSIAGTIIQQQPTPSGYERIYGPTVAKIIKALELYDMYHSWWFQLLLVLFAINLLVCSIDRLPRVLRFFKKEERFKPREFLDSLPIKCTSKGRSKDVKEALKLVEDVLSSHGFHPKERVEEEKRAYLFAEKGLLNRLGVYVTHFSILIVLLGGLIGSFFGFTGYMTIVEGGKSNNVVLRDGTSNKLLPFVLKCKSFEVIFYKNRPDVPKDYISWIEVIDGGKKVLEKKIEVNHPLVYKGIYFYQSSYGVFSAGEGILTLKVKDKNTGKVEEVSLKVGQEKNLPDLGVSIRLLAFYPDFVLTQNGPTSRSDELNNPAALVEILKDGKTINRTWVFAFFPNVHQKKSNYEVKFVNYKPVFYTVLQVSRDPGVWLVWVGCILMIAAIMMTFFWSHRRVFVWIEEKGKGVEVALGFTTNRNQDAFREKAEVICKNIKERL